MLNDGIVESSKSPWRAQIVVVKNGPRKSRLAIDYSETINRFTLPDGYPLPRIDDTISKIAHYRVFSTIDLRSAYHHVPIKNEDKLYTAFEACGRLYHFNRILFGITNGVACFQRIMNTIIEEEDLTGTFAYLDDVTVCGVTQEEHDENLQKFLSAAKRRSTILTNVRFLPPGFALLGMRWKVVRSGLIPQDWSLCVAYPSQRMSNSCAGLLDFLRIIQDGSTTTQRK